MGENKTPSREMVLNEINRIYQEQNKINTVIFKENQTLVDTNSKVDYLFNKYGKMTDLCKELEIPFTRANQHDKADIIADIFEVYQKHGEMKYEIYKRYGKYSGTCIRSHFGNFNDMLKELGFPINMHKKVTREDIKKDVLDFYKRYHTTSTNKYRKIGKYSECSVNRLFDTWKNLMEELDLPYAGETYGYDEIMRQVKNVYDRYGFISKDLINTECDFSYQALNFYFKDKNEISAALEVDDAFCDTNSQMAKITKKILILLFGEDKIEYEKTWDWLRNPKTNKMLPVDFYIDFLKLGIEYDGEQHDRFVPRFHKTEDGFKEAQERDQFKDNELPKHGITLIRISHKEKVSIDTINLKIIQALLERIPMNE